MCKQTQQLLDGVECVCLDSLFRIRLQHEINTLGDMSLFGFILPVLKMTLKVTTIGLQQVQRQNTPTGEINAVDKRLQSRQ